MSKVIQQFINGKLVADLKQTHFSVYNPALGKVAREVCFASIAEVDQAVDAAKTAFQSWKKVTPLKRARVIFKFKYLLEQHSERLAEILTEEHGKVIEDARGEVMRGIELVEYMCGIPQLLRGTYSQNVGPGIDCYTIRQPLGVCVGITPFNFPVMIGCWMFVSAIACGNSFVLKPAEKNPSASMFMADLMQQAGLPDGVLNVVHGDKKVVTQLITHPDVQSVECVGSSVVSEAIYKTAIDHGKRSHTFGGAKNHCIIMPDTDIDEAATALSGAAFGAAGERCMALSVAVVVGNDTADALVAKIKAQIPNLKIGSGINPGLDLGPLVTKEHWQRVKSYIDLGVEEGATLVADGRDYVNKENPDGFFMGASLFDHVTPAMKIYQDEIFGPVLIVIRVKTLDEAIDLINNHAYGNGTAILTNSGDAAHRFAEEIQVGMVGVNVPIPVPVAFHTFGGWKRSVFGDLHMHGPESIFFYTKSKSVTSRWPKQKSAGSGFHMPSN